MVRFSVPDPILERITSHIFSAKHEGGLFRDNQWVLQAYDGEASQLVRDLAEYCGGITVAHLSDGNEVVIDDGNLGMALVTDSAKEQRLVAVFEDIQRY